MEDEAEPGAAHLAGIYRSVRIFIGARGYLQEREAGVGTTRPGPRRDGTAHRQKAEDVDAVLVERRRAQPPPVPPPRRRRPPQPQPLAVVAARRDAPRDLRHADGGS